MITPAARPAWWIAALPLLLLPCCWLWWWAAGLNPGLEVGRSADLLLLVACAGAAWGMRTATLPAAVVPLLLALAWQAVALLWAPVREPGVIWLVERAAACAAAIAIATWTSRTALDLLIPAAAAAGTGMLALTCLTQYGETGSLLRVGREAPFGNVNFTIGAALPLVALGLARFVHGGGRWWWLWAAATAGCAGALAGGWLGGDPCHAVWLGGSAAVASALVLRLPARWQGPALLAGGGMLLLAWAAPIAGVTDAPGLGAGTAQRIHIWRGTLESLASPAALVGHGPAAIIAVLPEQPSFGAIWLTVPSYAAHAHAEPLQVLCDGGLVLAALLAWSLLRTLRPLWRRRAEPTVAALLVGWCTAGALCLVESHLSQPGGLLCLALLSGLSWHLAETGPSDGGRWRLRAAVPLLCGAVLATLIVRELAYDGGGPVGIEARSIPPAADAAAELAALDRLRERLGPLDNIDLRRAYALGKLRRTAESDAALSAHLRRNPADASGLALARRRIASGHADPALVATAATAHQRARVLATSVRRNPVNATALDELAAELSRAGDGPAPAH